MTKRGTRRNLALKLLVWLSICSVGAGMIPFASWPVDLLSELRPQLIAFALLTLLLIFTLWRRQSDESQLAGLVLPCILLAALCAGSAAEIASTRPIQSAAKPTENALRITFHNLSKHNPDQQSAISALLGGDSDLLILAECSIPALATAQANAPDKWHLVQQDPRDTWGISVLSRLPARALPVVIIGPGGSATACFEVSLQGKPLRILAVHLQSPKSHRLAEQRDLNLSGLSAWAVRSMELAPTIVIGDFNTAPWSAAWRSTPLAQQLVEPFRGPLSGTWPSWAGPFGVPIDRAIHSPDLHLELESGPANGSDHRSLIARVTYSVAE